MECLAELGWSGTSTTEVARRAGVSRGAQQHHYPTKMLLVAAALEHLLERQRLAYERAFAGLPAERRNIEGALDLLWESFRQAPSLALMELAMAARTDESLRGLSIGINERVVQVILETFLRLFPASVDEEVAGTLIRSVFATLLGLTLQNSLDDDACGHQAAVLTQIKSLARLIIPD
jgi:AcrR family transcriptional regulator